MTKQELIAHIEAYPDDEHFAVHIWSLDDIILKARENNIVLTDKEAAEILDKLERNIDSEYGLNWNAVNDGILDYALEHDKVKDSVA